MVHSVVQAVTISSASKLQAKRLRTARDWKEEEEKEPRRVQGQQRSVHLHQ